MSLISGRVIEIFVPAGKIVGSGYLLTHRMVLTAFHVVATITSRPRRLPVAAGSSFDNQLRALANSGRTCRVRTLSSTPRRPFSDAAVVWWSADLDVALLAVVDANWIEPTSSATDWDNITGSDPVEFKTVGFPAIEQSADGRSRESRELYGTIAPLTRVKDERWALQLGAGIGSTPVDRSAWAGVSGAAVFVQDSLVGVVQSDVDPTDKTRLELRAVPARLFAGNTDFIAWLTADAGANAWRKASDPMPAPPSHVPGGSFLDSGVPQIRDLVGRDALLAEAREHLLSRKDTALLSGLPGAGKTALAANLARDDQINAAFPDGRLWLAVGKVGPGGMTYWVNRMALWGQQLGVSPDLLAEAQADQDGERLVELINFNLGERRVLLVFDDVWERDDAILFKGIGPECVRLLTTRLPRVANFFARKPTLVEELDRSSSLDLIELYCPGARRQLGDALDNAIAVIAGLPLALILVAQRLKDELSYSTESGRAFLHKVQSVEARLDLPLDIAGYDQRSRVRGVHRTLQAVIGLTANGLSDQQMQALRTLTAFPPKLNTFSGAAATFLVGDEYIVRSIQDMGLVQREDMDLVERLEISSPRYSMHQAIADFARRGREGDDDSYHRMAEYFIGFIEEAVNSTSDQWVYTLEPEFENIRAALSWSVRAQQAHIGLRLMAALWPYWYERNLFQRARELAKRVLSIPAHQSEASRDYLLLRAKVLNDAGNYAYNMADLTEALELHNEALQIRSELHEEGLTAGSKNNIALVFRERGDYLTAANLFSAALEINERTRHPSWRLWRCMNLNNLGITNLRLDNLAQARDYQERSEAAFRDLGNSWGVAMTRLNRADVMLAQNDPSVAPLLSEVLSERWAVRDDKAVAAAMRGFAVLRRREADPARARRYGLASLLLAAPLADRLGEGSALQILVLACRDRGDWREGARAGGALRGYWDLSTAQPTEARAAELLSAMSEMREHAPKEYEEQFHQAYDVAARGLSHLSAALGSSLREIDPEAEVFEVLATAE